MTAYEACIHLRKLGFTVHKCDRYSYLVNGDRIWNGNMARFLHAVRVMTA